MPGGRKQKQEQEDATPEVTEVGPGVLRLQLPISMPGLGHVNTYAIEDERGVTIVDPGLPGPASWKALQERMATAGLKLADVHTVIVTHSHPDHFGGVGRLVEETGADVVAHSAFMSWLQPHSHADSGDDADDHIHDVDPEDLPPRRSAAESGHAGPWGGGGRNPWGGSPMRPPLKRRMQMRVMRARMGLKGGPGGGRGRMAGYMPPAPTRKLKHGDVIKLGRREWFAVHTPGHTLDHLCLHDPEGGVLLSGDHVLPTITPHIGGLNSGRDPLGMFFDSLDRVAGLEGVRRVLPAHGHPFDDVVARTTAIKEHHHERLGHLQKVAREQGGPISVVEFSHHLFRKARWGGMAESETYAHLEHLRLAGKAERREADGELLYELDVTQ